MKGYLDKYDWLDSLVEVGQDGEVGTGMINKLKKVIRETYKAGFKDGEASTKKRNAGTKTCSRSPRS